MTWVNVLVVFVAYISHHELTNHFVDELATNCHELTNCRLLGGAARRQNTGKTAACPPTPRRALGLPRGGWSPC